MAEHIASVRQWLSVWAVIVAIYAAAHIASATVLMAGAPSASVLRAVSCLLILDGLALVVLALSAAKRGDAP